MPAFQVRRHCKSQELSLRRSDPSGGVARWRASRNGIPRGQAVMVRRPYQKEATLLDDATDLTVAI